MKWGGKGTYLLETPGTAGVHSQALLACAGPSGGADVWTCNQNRAYSSQTSVSIDKFHLIWRFLLLVLLLFSWESLYSLKITTLGCHIRNMLTDLNPSQTFFSWLKQKKLFFFSHPPMEDKTSQLLQITGQITRIENVLKNALIASSSATHSWLHLRDIKRADMRAWIYRKLLLSQQRLKPIRISSAPGARPSWCGASVRTELSKELWSKWKQRRDQKKLRSSPVDAAPNRGKCLQATPYSKHHSPQISLSRC